jgi:Las17-binding protein actin regulator
MIAPARAPLVSQLVALLATTTVSDPSGFLAIEYEPTADEAMARATGLAPMTSSPHFYEIRPRKDHRGVDLISDALPFGRLWYGEPNAVSNGIDYAKFYSRSHDAVIRVFDGAGWGLQAGAQVTDFVIVLNNSAAVQGRQVLATQPVEPTGCPLGHDVDRS